MNTMSNVKINLFTTEMEFLGEYFASAVPREGEHLHWEDTLYEVQSVTWEGLPDSPAIQVRVTQ